MFLGGCKAIVTADAPNLIKLTLNICCQFAMLTKTSATWLLESSLVCATYQTINCLISHHRNDLDSYFAIAKPLVLLWWFVEWVVVDVDVEM